MSYSQTSLFLAPWLVLASLATPVPAFAQAQDLGPAPDASSVAHTISANGKVILGYTLFSNAFADRGFRSTDAEGFGILPTFNGGFGFPVGVSDDGTYVAGFAGSSYAIRWSEAGPPIALVPTAVSSTATAISGDGSTIVGAFSQDGDPRHALRWTEAGGPVDIHPSFVPPNFKSWASAVSYDGSVVVGYTWNPFSGTNFLPQAFVWTAATGAVDIGLSAFADVASATAVSDDGSVVVGTGRFITQQLQPFVWTAAGGMIPLGEVGTDFFMDVGVSRDGSTVYGVCKPEGFRWTQAGGLQIFSITSGSFHPTCATHDGATLAGSVELNPDSRGAATWNSSTGVSLLPVAAGMSGVALGITPDGSEIVGVAGTPSRRRATRWRTDGTIGEPYCDPASANSASATGAYLTLSGSNRLVDGALSLNVVDLPPLAFGFFLGSRERDLAVMPGGSQGTLCLGGEIGRFVGPGQIMNSGTQGAISLTVDPNALPSPTGPVSASFGETWHFQAWYRDANPGATSNFSSAGSVVIY